jgi:hypothetical protein
VYFEALFEFIVDETGDVLGTGVDLVEGGVSLRLE